MTWKYAKGVGALRRSKVSDECERKAAGGRLGRQPVPWRWCIHMWLSQVEFGSDGAEAISELAPRAYAGHVHAAVSEERARKGGQEDGQAMRVMLSEKREASWRR